MQKLADIELRRLRVLTELALLDSAPDREFDALAKLAKSVMGTKIALLSLIDADRQWFKAKCGLDLAETAREPSFCTVAVEADAPLIVTDARIDPRFAQNPFVLGEPQIRFYAGVPVRVKSAGDETLVPIGSLCVIDDVPREITPSELSILNELACIAEALIEARSTALRAAELAEERQVALEQLERERRLLKQAERIADIGSWRLTLSNNRLEWSDGVFGIHELPVGSLPPLDTALEFYPEPYRGLVAAAVAKTIDTGEPFELECDFVTAKGNLRRVRSLGEVELSRGKPIALIGVFQDITDRYRLEQSALNHARTDDLTRLPNRAEFNRVLDERLTDTRIVDQDVAVLLIDLDGFKNVNDTLGHGAGDEVLRQVGKRLRAPDLSRCFAARLGGDEFAVIVPSTDRRDDFKELISRLLDGLKIEIREGGQTASTTGSIGVAWSKGFSITREDLLRRADAALYEVKRTRKGTARTFSPPAVSSVEMRRPVNASQR